MDNYDSVDLEEGFAFSNNFENNQDEFATFEENKRFFDMQNRNLKTDTNESLYNFSSTRIV